VRAVPRQPPGSDSSCDSTGMGESFMRTCDRRVCSAMSRSFFDLIVCSLCMYPVSLQLGMFMLLPD
jgi:hypothetical protein